MQARDEVNALMNGFPDSLLWERPGGDDRTVASVGFHLQHLTGVLDRLFTYARGEILSADQLIALSQEDKPNSDTPVSAAGLVRRFDEQVNTALAQLRLTDEETLRDIRLVGRAQVPSTVIGLLVHSAEHTTRHVGQLLVTVRWVGNGV